MDSERITNWLKHLEHDLSHKSIQVLNLIESQLVISSNCLKISKKKQPQNNKLE